jgi:6,7-dimethyl-8-ribityllumazine synthase
MTQASYELPTANGAFRAARIAFVHGLWHGDIVRQARTGRYAAIVAAAFVVDGGVYRHEFVAETVVAALMQVQLATETPVFSVVLTPHHFHEHETHQRFFHDHFRLKGQEAARACALTLESLARLAAAA